MPRPKITDQRIIEACMGRDVDINTASPQEIVDAYCGWKLGDPAWGSVILDIARNAGMKISSENDR